MPVRRDTTNITYEYLIDVLDARLPGGSRPLRILDAGCGGGAFILYGQSILPNRGHNVELHGFDVLGHGVQRAGFVADTIVRLGDAHPEIEWGQRISSVGADEDWPYPTGFFDVVVSNQVLEHVVDLPRFLKELDRVLAPQGASFHLFPLLHVLHEWHMHLPLAHKLRSHGLRRWYIATLSKLGRGIYDGTSDVWEFAAAHADYVAAWTAYRSWREFSAAAHSLGLRVDYGLTYEFYASRLRRSGIRLPTLGPSETDHMLVRAAFFHLAKYASSVCIEISRASGYDPGWSQSGQEQ